jgi:hypothetical protein
MTGDIVLRTIGGLYLGNYASTIQIGTGSVANTITIGNVSSTMNISSSMINLGNASTTQILVGNTSMTGDIVLRTIGGLYLGNYASTIQIGTGSVANTITIGNVSTATLVVGNSSMTGTVTLRTTGNLFLGTTATTINMGTTLGNNTISIGNASSTLSLAGTTIGIGNATTLTNAITIGNISSSVNMSGTIIGNTYKSTTATSAVTLFNNVTTSSIEIGNGLTTGVINLGPTNLTADIVSNCNHQFNKGITFQNSNVQGDKILTGTILTTNGIAAGGFTIQIHTYTSSYTFGSAPRIMAQINSTTLSCNVIVQTENISTTGFMTVARNVTATSVAANSYAIQYLAIGDI